MITSPSTCAAPSARDASVDELVDRARALIASGERRILGIVGAPGAGKSTLCAALLDALGDDAVLVGMDGFHLANEELLRRGSRDRKGAPDTFDVDGYVALLGRLADQEADVVYAPLFDRSIEQAIGSAVPVGRSIPLVITEGNYLLATVHGWGAVAAHLDETWYLDVPAAERERRLVGRRTSFGEDADRATSWVRDVDMINADVVEADRGRADLVLTLPPLPGRPVAAALSPAHTSASEGVAR